MNSSTLPEEGPSSDDKTTLVSSPTKAASPQFEDAHVIVSIRARPLNQREIAWTEDAHQQHEQLFTSSSKGEKRTATMGNSETLLISQDGKNLVILEKGVPTKFKEWSPEAQNLYVNGLSSNGCHRFAFDHIYGTASTQEELFRDIGLSVLANSMKGFNTCIFAYGQTGSGKSYSMMGPEGGAGLEKDPGLIPRLCDALFDEMKAKQAENAARLAEAKEEEEKEGAARSSMSDQEACTKKGTGAAPALPSEVEFCVYVSYLEIYRERVRCLLGGTASGSAVKRRPKGATSSSSSPSKPESAAEAALHTLRVRQHPTLGVYVEGLKEVPVERKEQMLKLMSVGNFNRHTASTRMNDTSSRSHAIFTITVVQRRKGKTRSGDEKITELRSKMNLVDLAGSERVQSTGAEGEVLKEGALINLSLTTLGLVISVLADNSQHQAGKEKHVPYRDSTLTFLLKESLGGSSKTFMLSNISPSIMHYDETLSTLRFADRAKSIVTRAFVNESAGDRRIRELENEVNRLRETIRQLQTQSSAPPTEAATVTAVLSQTPEAPRDVAGAGVSTDSFSDLENEGDGMGEDEEVKKTSIVKSEKKGTSSASSSTEDVDSDVDEAELAENSEPRPAESPTTALAHMGADLAPRVDVDALQQELARAEDAIRQMTATEAEREAETAAVLQSLKEKEEEIARRSATMRLARSDPYLLNVDGIGNWVAAYLSKPWTSLGTSPEGEKKEDEETQYLFIPCEEADNIGDPHIRFSRDLVTSCVRACPALGCSTFLNYSPIPLLGKETILRSGDVLSLGHVDGPQFRFIDPAEPPTTARGARTVSRPLGAGQSPTTSAAASPVAARPAHTEAAAEPPSEAKSAIVFDPTVEKQKQKEEGGGSREASTWSDSVAGGMARGATTADPDNAIRGASLFSVTSHTLRSADFNSPFRADGEKKPVEDEVEEASPSPVDRRRRGHPDATAEEEEEREDQEEDDGPSPPPRVPDAGVPRLDFSPFTSRGNTGSTAATPPPAAIHATPAASKQETMASAGGGGAKLPTPVSSYKPQANKDGRLGANDIAVAAGTSATTEPHEETFETFNEERRLLNRHSFVLLGETGAGKTSFKENLRRVNDALLSGGGSGSSAVAKHADAKEKDLFQHFINNLFRKEDYRDEMPSPTVTPSVPPTFGLQSSTITVRKGGAASDTSEENTMQLIFFDLGGAPCFLPLLEIAPSRRVTYILTFSLVSRVVASLPASGSDGDLDGFSPVPLPPTFQPASPSLELFKTILELILSRTDNRDVSILLLATQADLFLTCYRDDAARQGVPFSSGRPGGSNVPGLQEMHEVISVLEQEVQTYLQLLQPNIAMRPVIVGRFAVDSIHNFTPPPPPKPQPWSPFEKHTKPAAAVPSGQEVYSFDFANVKSWRELLWWISDHAQQCCRQDVDFANGLVPARCFTHLEDVLGQIKQTHKWCLAASDYRQLAKSVHPHYKVARSDLHAQTQLLQSFGVLYHRFRHALLKKFVILDTAWLYQLWSVLAACGFVTVKVAPPLSATANNATTTSTSAAGDQRRRRVVLLASPEALTPYCQRPKPPKNSNNNNNNNSSGNNPCAFGDVTSAPMPLPFDPLKVILADKYHLLPQGVLSFHVLSVLLSSLTRSEVHQHSSSSGGGGGVGTAAKRKSSYFSQLPDLLGVVEFLEMCDIVIRGSRVRYSDFRLNANLFVTGTAAAAATSTTTTTTTSTTATHVGRPTHAYQKGQVVSADSLNASSSSTTTVGTPHTGTTAAVVKVRGRVISPAFDAHSKNQAPTTASTSANETPRMEVSSGARVEPFHRPQPKSAWETFLLMPSNFQKKPPSCVILHFSKFLSGPFYRFRLRMAPVLFFSKLVSRLAAAVDVVTGVYIGPLHSQPVLAESPAIPLSSFTNEATAADSEAASCTSVGGSGAAAVSPSSSSLAGVVPTAASCAMLWQRTVWVVGHSSCRAFVRMIGHTLFVSFHAHTVGASGDRSSIPAHDGTMDYFYDTIVSTVRQVVEENPGVECDESLFCAAGYDVVWQTTEARLFAAKTANRDANTSTVDESDEEIDITTSEAQKEHVFYRAIDENINTLQKIRERDMFALQTARSMRDGSTSHHAMMSTPTPPRQDSELEEYDSFLDVSGDAYHHSGGGYEEEEEAVVVPFIRTRTADTPPIDAAVFIHAITSGHPHRLNEMQQAGCRVAIDLYNKSFATSPSSSVSVTDSSSVTASSSDALDKLLDVMAHLAL